MNLTDNFPNSWSKDYATQIERNIGLVSIEEQIKIKSSKIAILGTGGIGAPAALELAYAGCEHLVLCDFDRVDPSNLNRQPFTRSDIGKFKVDVLEERILSINPNIRIEKDYEVTEQNIDRLLNGVSVAALSLDGAYGSIVVARTAFAKKIPVIETWAVPYLFCWWFTDYSAGYESVYGLKTQGMQLAEIKSDPSVQLGIKQGMIKKLLGFPGITDTYDREKGALNLLLEGKIPLRSFAPIVWLNGSLMAMEIVYAGLLKIKPKVLAPQIQAYDYFRNQMITI